MISRKRILSNSCTHLSTDTTSMSKGCNFEEDVWYDKHSLFRDHIQEILNKYNQLDDEIWGKIICMERNRRVAKAYARSPVITVDNGTVGFDGDSIGLRGFDSPYRDSEILITHKSIGSGVAIGADEAGNILIQLIQQRTLYLRQLSSSCADDLLIKSNGKLKPGTVYKVFCMKKFLTKLNNLQCNDNSGKSNLSVKHRKQINGTVKQQSTRKHNLTNGIKSKSCTIKSVNGKSKTLSARTNNGARRHSNDDDEDEEEEDEDDVVSRVNLENNCFTVISLSSHPEGQLEPLLDTPVWIIVINIIALEMLHRNLNLINSSSSDLASSWSCSSCSTSCSDVERMNKSYSLSHHKSTGALNATQSHGQQLTDKSKCHRCRHSSVNVSTERESKDNHTTNGKSTRFKGDTEVISASERLSKLFVPLDQPKKGKTVVLNEPHTKRKGTDHKCRHDTDHWLEDDDHVDSSFSLSHSSSSTSHSSTDDVKQDRKGKSVKGPTDSQGNSSSSSSNGYALTSETTNSTSNSNKLLKRSLVDTGHHFIGHFNKSIDVNGEKYPSSNYKSKCSNCQCNCTGKEKVSSSTVSTVKSKNDYPFNKNSYICNSTSSSTSSFSSSFTSNGSGNFIDDNCITTGSKVEECGKNISPSSRKVKSATSNQMRSSKTICNVPTNNTDTMKNCTSGNVSTHSVTNNEQGELNALTLDTHFEEVEEEEDDDPHHHHTNDQHCTRAVQSKVNDKIASRRSTHVDHMASVSSFQVDHRIKRNNGHDTRELHSSIPTPDYDDSGNENYGFIGERGLGGNRLRLCTSNLLLDERDGDRNFRHCTLSRGPNFYIDSQLNKRLTRSSHYIHEADCEDEEIYTRNRTSHRAGDTLRSNSGFLNSVLRHLPLSTITSKQGRSGKYSLNYHSSWKRLSFPAIFNAMPPGHTESSFTPSMSSAGDSDNSYTHIYSSICDSAVGTSASINSNSVYQHAIKRGTSCSSGYAEYSDNSFVKNSLKKNTFINRMLSKSKGNTMRKDQFGGDKVYVSTNGGAFNPMKGKIIDNKKYSTMSMPSISLDEDRCKGKHLTLNGNLDESYALGVRPRSRSNQIDNTFRGINDTTRSSSDFNMLSKMYSMSTSIDNVHGDDDGGVGGGGDDDNKSTPVTSTTVKTNGLVKLARKGSKGLKRATSIPKTLKLFIKRNGKRGLSD